MEECKSKREEKSEGCLGLMANATKGASLVRRQSLRPVLRTIRPAVPRNIHRAIGPYRGRTEFPIPIDGDPGRVAWGPGPQHSACAPAPITRCRQEIRQRVLADGLRDQPARHARAGRSV